MTTALEQYSSRPTEVTARAARTLVLEARARAIGWSADDRTAFAGALEHVALATRDLGIEGWLGAVAAEIDHHGKAAAAPTSPFSAAEHVPFLQHLMHQIPADRPEVRAQVAAQLAELGATPTPASEGARITPAFGRAIGD